MLLRSSRRGTKWTSVMNRLPYAALSSGAVNFALRFEASTPVRAHYQRK
jgi:hypothetical protein